MTSSLESAVAPLPGYQVELDVFAGPLDLLLHLIRTQELDIYDIPIAQITEQYLRYLRMMEELNVTLAGEYVLMAATLIHIKSQMLLPAPPSLEGDESEDPREELVTQLLEYEKFKNAAQLLYERETVELSTWPRGLNEHGEEEAELVNADLIEVVFAFHRIVERYKERLSLEIEADPVSLEEVLSEIRSLLIVQSELYFSFFIRENVSRFRLVLTFFALLDLVKSGEVRLRQKGLFEDIRILAC